MGMVQVRNLRFREVKTLLRFTWLVSSRAGPPSSRHLTAEPEPLSTGWAYPSPFLFSLALGNPSKFGVAAVSQHCSLLHC